VEDPFSANSRCTTPRTISLEKLAEVLGVERVNNFKVIERYPSGRVKTVEAGINV